MVNDMNDTYEYPFEFPSEDEIAFGDNAIEGRPPGLPSARPGRP